MDNGLKAAYFTLGCKLNFAETSTIGRLLGEQGITKAGPGERPDICVVNTCSVTAVADKKCRQLMQRLHRQWPEAAIVATGCYAQLKPGEVSALPGVSVVLGAAEKLRAAQWIEQWLRSGSPTVSVSPTTRLREFMPSCERGDRTRYFLKVQDGCDAFCTYCTIPLARGRSRSPSIASLVEQAREAARAGGREIILTGVNIGDFGKGRSESFFDLCRALDEVEGIERYRISSIEPDLLTPELIEWVGRESRAFMPHFHIPLQSGSDAVLRLMGRRYDTALFADRIAAVNESVADCFIGVDVIAGARGETPEEWERSYRFIESLRISRLHVFPYSERPGTRALSLGGSVEQGERHRRVRRLTELSERKLAGFIAGQGGMERPVLWESIHGQRIQGLTDNYIRVSAPADPSLCNTITRVRLPREAGLPEPVDCTILTDPCL